MVVASFGLVMTNAIPIGSARDGCCKFWAGVGMMMFDEPIMMMTSGQREPNGMASLNEC